MAVPQCIAVPLCAGDVLLHTVTDAILGALSLPDIGERATLAALLLSNDTVYRAIELDQ